LIGGAAAQEAGAPPAPAPAPTAPAPAAGQGAQPLPSVVVVKPAGKTGPRRVRRAAARAAPRAVRTVRPRRPAVRPPVVPAAAPRPTTGPGSGAPRPETAFGPVPGYVAHRSATATKTDTPIIETPQSVSVVTRDQIEAQGADSAKRALRYSAGIAAENRANFGGFDIMYSRGFALPRYQDGMRIQGDALAMTPQPELYDMERVEVLRGPASVLFGQGSPGGLVNMVTKRPTDTPFREILLQGGSYDRFQGGFDLGGPADRSGQWLYRFTGYARDAGNQVDFVKEQRVMIAPALTWRPSACRTRACAWRARREPFLI
jgi:iron complex outermembrane receptor protein